MRCGPVDVKDRNDPELARTQEIFTCGIKAVLKTAYSEAQIPRDRTRARTRLSTPSSSIKASPESAAMQRILRFAAFARICGLFYDLKFRKKTCYAAVIFQVLGASREIRP